jgi:hypothetical protein
MGVDGERLNMIDLDKVLAEEWELKRTNKDGEYIYEFWHRPNKVYCPKGRYLKYTVENGDILVIEDGPYLGKV